MALCQLVEDLDKVVRANHHFQMDCWHVHLDKTTVFSLPDSSPGVGFVTMRAPLLVTPSRSQVIVTGGLAAVALHDRLTGLPTTTVMLGLLAMEMGPGASVIDHGR